MDAVGCGDFADRARIFLKIVRRVKRHCLTRFPIRFSDVGDGAAGFLG